MHSGRSNHVHTTYCTLSKSTYFLQADVRNHNNHIQVPETEVTAHGDRLQYISAHMYTQCRAQTYELSMFRMWNQLCHDQLSIWLRALARYESMCMYVHTLCSNEVRKVHMYVSSCNNWFINKFDRRINHRRPCSSVSIYKAPGPWLHWTRGKFCVWINQRLGCSPLREPPRKWRRKFMPLFP